ncbi:unnamed protein product [Effrenium voratum]|nr:unnamed protein product [Effrenium voratum]
MAADDLASLSRRIRGMQRKLRRRRAGDDVGQGVLSSKTASAAIMVYVFSGHNLDVAAAFLLFKFHLADDCMEDTRCMVENAYLQEPNSRVVELMNDQCVATRSMRVMTTACTFILHRQLYVWLCKQNCERGVAPSRTQMIRRALSVAPSDCPLEVQACVEAPLRGSARRQRKWLRRFRRVWGARVGSLQPISTLSVQEMQEKAFAYFRWVNGALAQSDKAPLIINMDEASLAFHLTGVVGTVLKASRLSRLQPGDRAKLSARRGALTHIASICNDPAFNDVLPQILLGNTRQFILGTLQTAQAEAPANVYLWREKSSWNNTRLMQKYIQLLCHLLGGALQERTVYLVVDMAACRTHPSVHSCALEKGLRMILVPAGMTGVLQPLDVYVFRQFRSKIQELWLECKENAKDGEVTLLLWLRVVCGAIQSIISGRPWQNAFQRTGLMLGQSLLSSQILKALDWSSCPAVPDTLPAVGQALLADELKNLKDQRRTLREAMKKNKMDRQAADRRKSRVVKARCRVLLF